MNDLIINPQSRMLALQRQRVLGMIGALESTLAVLKSEAELLDRLIETHVKPSEVSR